jgi:N-ATPase, AtpR subunit
MAMDARTMIAALWLLVGLAGGVAYFALLRRNTMLFLSSWQASCLLSTSSLGHAIALQVLRLAAIAILLGFAARQGALPLLLAALGIMLARTLVLRAMQVAA